jgi:long-chain acyl-CoA synthetase
MAKEESVTRIEHMVNTTLLEWGNWPTFLQVSQTGGAAATTSAELSRQIAETARQLHAWGIREKFLVPIFMSNSTDFAIIFFSLLHIGAIPVFAKLEYRTLELDEIFRNAQPQAIVADEEHLRFLKPYLMNTIVVTRAENRFFLAQSAEGLKPREEIPDDIASINYTYRGYGYPLGAMLSHAQYLHGARVLQDGLRGEAGEKMLIMLPMAHVFTIVGCILVPLLYRMTGIIVDTLRPRLLFQYIRDFRIEHVTSIPEIFELLCRLRDPLIDLSSLKAFVSGGSFLTPEGYRSISEAFSIDLGHGYGLTEFTPVSRGTRDGTQPGTIGPLCDQVECRIDASSPGEAGEIQIKTPHIIGTYYRKPRESSEAHRDGWFRTGDIGRFDDESLVFVKELKNTRKVNGTLVDLEEVTRAIRLDKEVAEVRVEWENNSLVAHIGLSRHVDFKEQSKLLKSFLRENLAEYKIPKSFRAL